MLVPEGLASRAAEGRLDNLPDKMHVGVELEGLKESHKGVVGAGLQGGGIAGGVPDDLGGFIGGGAVDGGLHIL
jgi:hypothetical protein